MKTSHVKLFMFSVIVSILFLFSESVTAKIELQLIKPEKFRDIDVADKSEKYSISEARRDAIALFEAAAKDYLGEGDTLLIEVLDIDIAGRIDHMLRAGNNEIRVIRDNDLYRLKFRFKLKNKSGEITKEGEKYIHEFLKLSRKRYLGQVGNSLSYMKQPLDKWFTEEFSQ